MNDKSDDKLIAWYNQNWEQARSLNNHLYRIPTISMTITGGIWYIAGVTENVDPIIRAVLLFFAGICNIFLILVSYKIRDVFQSYLEKIKLFEPILYVKGRPTNRRVQSFGGYSMLNYFVVLFAVAAYVSMAAALYYLPLEYNDQALQHVFALGIPAVIGWLIRGRFFGDTEEAVNTTIEYYQDHHDEYVSKTVNIDMSDIYPHFIEYIPEEGFILDAGSGSGRDSLAFLREGFHVDAFDASAQLAAHSSRLTGQLTAIETFETFIAPREYDGVWACNSLLHLEDSALYSTLVKFEKCLQSDGVIFASFREGVSHRVDNVGRFFNDFNAHRFSQVIKNTELEIVKQWVSGAKVTYEEPVQWINFILKKSLVKRNK